MNSCHLFNFLFNTKRTSSDLSRCFAAFSESNRKRSRRKSSQADKSEPESEDVGGSNRGQTFLKQVKMRLNRTGLKLEDESNNDNNNIISIEKKEPQVEESEKSWPNHLDGTYRATLVRSLSFEDPQLRPESNQELEPKSTDPSRPKDDIDSIECSINKETNIEKSIEEDEEEIPRKPRRFILYSGCDQEEEDKTICSSAEVFNIAKSEDTFRQNVNRPDKIGKSLVRNLVLSFESNRSSDKSFSEDDDISNQENSSIDCSNVRERPCSLVKPLPPKISPKSKREKYLNTQLTLNKPTQIRQLFLDKQFLERFFEYLEPLDLCTGAQVCSVWQKVLYNRKDFWKDLMIVIDYSKLRREHTVECIVNMIKTAGLKQSFSNQRRRSGHQITPRVQGRQVELISELIDIQGSVKSDRASQQQNGLSSDGQSSESSPTITTTTLDLEDVWRIQEVCNRLTENPSILSDQELGSNRLSLNDLGQISLNQDVPPNGQHNNRGESQQTPKSTSIPSQISSTLSSASLSSLVSPISETSRMETIKKRLYYSIEQRGFDSICFFAATRDDFIDFINKLSPDAIKCIKRIQFRNCSITDNFIHDSIKHIKELELLLCNSLTNELDLKLLDDLESLTIQDCINISDEFADNMLALMPRLKSLNIHAYHLSDFFPEYLGCFRQNKIKQLAFPNCKDISNQTLMSIVKYFSSVDILCVAGTRVNDEGIQYLASKMNHLVSLNLGWCSMITDDSLESIATGLGDSLTELVLDRNSNITNRGIKRLASMRKLEYLSLRWCLKVTDLGIEFLLRAPSLRYLSLAGLRQLTTRSLLRLPETKLVEVELTNCPAVSHELLKLLSDKMKNCSLIV